MFLAVFALLSVKTLTISVSEAPNPVREGSAIVLDVRNDAPLPPFEKVSHGRSPCGKQGRIGTPWPTSTAVRLKLWSKKVWPPPYAVPWTRRGTACFLRWRAIDRTAHRGCC